MLLFTVLMGVWILLSGSLQWDELWLGSVVALTVVWMVRKNSLGTPQELHESPLKFPVQMVPALLGYLRTFLVALVRANFDLARRVVDPALPISPVLVEVETALQSSLGRVILANSITLTPGTLTVDIQQQRLLIHWIDDRGLIEEGQHSADDQRQQATKAIADQFERHLRVFLR